MTTNIILLILQIFISLLVSIMLYLFKQKDNAINTQIVSIKEKQKYTDNKIEIIEDNINQLNLKIEAVEKDILIQITEIKGIIEVLNEKNNNINKNLQSINEALKYVKKRRTDST